GCGDRRDRLHDTRPGFAARALGQLPRLSDGAGPGTRVRRDRHGGQSAGRSRLHDHRPPRGGALGMAVVDAIGAPPLHSRLWREITVWSTSLKVGTSLFAVILLAGILAPWLTPYDPLYQDYNSILLPPGLAHPFGTDMNGRDILARTL